MAELTSVIDHSVMITLFVFVMMLIMQANTIIKASAISLPGTKGCARILFVTQWGKL